MSEEPAEDTKARVLRSKARTRRLSASLVKPVRGPYFASGIPPPIRIVPPPSKVWAPVLVKPGKRVFSAAVSASCRSCLRGAWSIFRRVLFQARLWVSQRLERLLDLLELRSCDLLVPFILVWVMFKCKTLVCSVEFFVRGLSFYPEDITIVWAL